MNLRALGVFGALGASAVLAVVSCSGSSVTPLIDGGDGDGSMTTNPDGTTNPCSGGMVQCIGKCTDVQTDNANCGMCGKACGAKEQCSGGACVSCAMIDKDKDGFNACDDCDDSDPMINPAAFDVPGNMKDDNCNMKVDEVEQCDNGLASDSMNASDMAKAIDICDPNAMASYPTIADGKTHQIAVDWGSVFKPQHGVVLGALSSGIAADTNSTAPMFDAMNTPQPGTDFGKTGTVFPVPPQSYACGNGTYTDPMSAFDYTELMVKLKVPTNAKSFAIDAAYLSAEYPESLCNGSTPNVDDPAFILLDSMAFKGNIAVGGARGRSLSVKSGLLAYTTAQQLAGTGMEKLVMNTPAGAATPWMTIEGPVVPGETITLRFIVMDLTDGIWDTQLLLDHFRWQTKSVCAPSTTVLGDAGLDAGAPMCPDGGIMDAGGQ